MLSSLGETTSAVAVSTWFNSCALLAQGPDEYLRSTSTTTPDPIRKEGQHPCNIETQCPWNRDRQRIASKPSRSTYWEATSSPLSKLSFRSWRSRAATHPSAHGHIRTPCSQPPTRPCCRTCQEHHTGWLRWDDCPPVRLRSFRTLHTCPLWGPNSPTGRFSTRNRSPPSISSMIARCLAGCKDFFGRSSISS